MRTPSHLILISRRVPLPPNFKRHVAELVKPTALGKRPFSLPTQMAPHDSFAPTGPWRLRDSGYEIDVFFPRGGPNAARYLGSRISFPASRIPHPASRIPHPASRIPHPASRIPHLASRIPHPASRMVQARVTILRDRRRCHPEGALATEDDDTNVRQSAHRALEKIEDSF